MMPTSFSMMYLACWALMRFGALNIIDCVSKKYEKRQITETAVTPTHNAFRRSKLDTVAGSARRVFLCEGVVQGRSRSGSCARPCEKSKKAKKGESLKRPQLQRTMPLDTHNAFRHSELHGFSSSKARSLARSPADDLCNPVHARLLHLYVSLVVGLVEILNARGQKHPGVLLS